MHRTGIARYEARAESELCTVRTPAPAGSRGTPPRSRHRATASLIRSQGVFTAVLQDAAKIRRGNPSRSRKNPS